MRISIVLLFGLVTFAVLCSARPAENDADYEDEPAPPPKKPARPLTANRRNPLSPRANAKPSSTTTTTAAPEEEEVVNEEDYEDEVPQEEPSSTTEAPKKNFLKSGVVRPFRSNDELLAALKKRREQVGYNKITKPAHTQSEEQSAPAAAVEKESPKKTSAAPSSSGRRNRFNAKEKNSEPAAEEPAAAQSTPARTGRRFGGRS